MTKQQYKIDLSRQLAECDLNYIRLMKVMPDMSAGACCEFGVSGQGGIRLEVVERFKYTATIKVSQRVALGEWSQTPSMLVRIYDDSCSAEVISCQRRGRLDAIYSYPNEHMYHSNEKAQLNEFLGEWLAYCLNCGYKIEEVFSF